MQQASRCLLLCGVLVGAEPLSLRDPSRKAGRTQLLQVGEKQDPAVDWASVDTVHHDKEKGNGYNPGSPLYEKQEAAKSGRAMMPAVSDVGNMDQEEVVKEYKHNWQSLLWAALVTIVFYVIVAAIFLHFFRGKEEKFLPVPPHPAQKEFTFGLFAFQNCFGQDLRICLCSWCCLPIRWADTMSDEEVKGGKFMGFWPALLIFLIPFALAGLTGGIASLVLIILVVYYRQQLRKRYGFEEGDCKTVCLDCLSWWCCSCCAAVQEARQVKYTPVYIQDTPAKPAGFLTRPGMGAMR